MKVEINLIKIFVFSAIFLIFVSSDMFSTYRFVNVLGIEKESNYFIKNLYPIFENLTFPLYALILSIFYFIFLLGFSTFLKIIKLGKIISEIWFYGLNIFVYFLFFGAFIHNLGAV